MVQGFGLPNDLISGSVLGFDYTTVSAKIGIGINAIYDVSTQVTNKYTNYYFSDLVQIYNSDTKKWSDARDHVTLGDEQSLVLRTVTPTTSLTMPVLTSLASTTATLKIALERIPFSLDHNRTN
ncbi:hypothetical protein SPAN111604_14785 [Sphingomonas antarctica]|uniref:hypothetical protein n=1 Tax=Sphingomonas antarctica TaxID=2040274 RepID=UPI0039EBE4BA